MNASDIARSILLAGDVVPFPSDQARPGINDIPQAPGLFPNSYSPYMQNYDYRWHQILTPPPANDASNTVLPEYIG